MWDLIVSVPDHCLSFYFPYLAVNLNKNDFSVRVLTRELLFSVTYGVCGFV